MSKKLKNPKTVSNEIISKNWKEVIRQNIHKNTKLSLNEKLIAYKIVKKDNLNEEDKKQLISLLSKLPTEQIISLLGENFNNYTQNYIKWGWDFDISVKRLLLNNYLRDLKSIHSNKQKLFDDKEKKIKECGYCHQILSYNEFFKVRNKSDEVRPYCKRCSSDLNLIRQYRKKLRLILSIYEGKCSSCGLDSIYLPVFQFHHPNPKQKTTSWRKIRGRNYKFIKNKLKLEAVILLCSNCHLKTQAKVLSKFIHLILKKDLFKLNPDEINKLIINRTKNIPNKLERMHIREKIKEWIKKRYIIEQLYNGKCIGCGNSDLFDLEFHHTNPKIDNKVKWDKLENLDSETILRQLINQNCICICSNCHSLLHSRYTDFAEEILKDFYSNDIILQKVKLIRSHLERLLNNISNFNFHQKNLKINPPLVLEIPHTDNWKIHILKIYYYNQLVQSELFKAYDLKEILEISIRHVYKHLNRFIKNGYIIEDPKIKGRYKFSSWY